MNNTTNKKSTSKLWLYFMLISALSQIAIMAILFTLVAILFKLNLINTNNFHRFGFLGIVAVISANGTTGIVAAFLIGKQIIKPMGKLSNAMIDVSNGDFSVSLSGKYRFSEINEMYKNFNFMTQELSRIEMLGKDFVANVSHEFKTPLSAIEGYAMLLQSPDITNDSREEYTEKIINNTAHLTALTKNVLLLSKLENQSQILEKSSFALDEQLRTEVLYLEHEWTKKNISFDFDMPDIQFVGNKNLLGQVWYNLISNAIKFSNEGGEIRIAAKSQKGIVSVTIEDHGIGIDEDKIDHIFDKFYQCDTSHSTNGNGLGLSIVKKIVTLSNGSISVVSKKGCGSTFTVELPIKD